MTAATLSNALIQKAAAKRSGLIHIIPIPGPFSSHAKEKTIKYIMVFSGGFQSHIKIGGKTLNSPKTSLPIRLEANHILL